MKIKKLNGFNAMPMKINMFRDNQSEDRFMLKGNAPITLLWLNVFINCVFQRKE